MSVFPPETRAQFAAHYPELPHKLAHALGHHPLLELDNLVLTPHLGSASNRTRRRMMEMTVENLRAALKGEPLPWRVV